MPLSVAAQRRALWVAFVLLTALDVISWRALWRARVPAPQTLHKAVFEYSAAGDILPRAVPWSYFMLPQPYFPKADVLVTPPGHPILVTLGAQSPVRALDVDVYEQRVPPLLQVQPRAEGPFLTLLRSEDGTPFTKPMRQVPPAGAALSSLERCFVPPGPLRISLRQTEKALTVTAGTCAWSFESDPSAVLIDAFGSSARFELLNESSHAPASTRVWVLVLVILASLVHRAGLRNARFVGTDAAGVVTVLLASLVSPLWLMLWGIKGVVGLVILAADLVSRARRSAPWRWGLAAGSLAVAAAAMTLDAHSLAALNTAYNEHDMGDDPAPLRASARSTLPPPDHTTHLVMGYSNVNGQALGRGAYGPGALDGVLQRACGSQRVFARSAVDGANGCFMAPVWNAQTTALDRLQTRIYFGGFNDDLTPPPSHFAIWISTVLGILPTKDPYPRPMLLWEAGARANLEEHRREELLGCLSSMLESGGRSSFIHVYDLATFDLGVPRRFGRDRWELARKHAVASRGGQYVDQRSLLPGESPVYFNDLSHLSEVGYRVLAQNLCTLVGQPVQDPSTASSEAP
jgi:hypothetical protein